MTIKICPCCKQEKQIEVEFTKTSYTSSGYSSYCKECKNKKTILSIQKYTCTPNGIAKRLLDLANRRAKEKQLICTLTRKWIRDKIEMGFCEVSGLPFTLNIKRGPFTPSLDKIDPLKDYTEDNVQVVACIYNFAKSNYNHSDVLTLAKALLEKQK